MIIKSEPVRELVAALVGAHPFTRVAGVIQRLLASARAVGVVVRAAAGIPLRLGRAVDVERRAQEGLSGRGPQPPDALVLRERFHQHGNQHHERRHE